MDVGNGKKSIVKTRLIDCHPSRSVLADYVAIRQKSQQSYDLYRRLRRQTLEAPFDAINPMKPI